MRHEMVALLQSNTRSDWLGNDVVKAFERGVLELWKDYDLFGRLCAFACAEMDMVF